MSAFVSSLIFWAASLILSRPISSIVLYPALKAGLDSSISSGSWTRMYFLLPPSSAFNFITAWAVVAEPEKKSRIIKFGVSEIFISISINCVGLGLEKILPTSKRFFNSKDAFLLPSILSPLKSTNKPPP